MRLPALFIQQPPRLEGRKKRDVIRKNPEFTDRARSGNLVYFLIEKLTFRGDNAKAKGVCHIESEEL
jgi:hypothetical protein